MRYTTLTKNLTAARLGLYNNLNDWKQRDLSKIVDQIREYHVEWASPMSRISVIEKFIGEFGFGVLYSVIIIIISYFAFRSPFTIDPLLIIMDGFAAILCEFYFVLFHSSYFKKIGNFAIHP